MKVSKPFIIFLPTQLVFDLKNYLKLNIPNFNYNEVYFYYFIQTLAFRMLRTKENEVYILINMQYYKAVTVSNIDKYITILENGGFIDVSKYLVNGKEKTYKKGRISRAYKINDKYLNAKSMSKIEIKPKTNLYKKILKNINNRKSHYNRLPKHLQLMQKKFMNIDFDYEKAFQYISDNKENFDNVLIHYTALQNINDKRQRYFFKSKSNNRLNTNLTSLWKELRPFIKGKYINIDLSNSQPFFLAIILNQINNKYINKKQYSTMYDISLLNYSVLFGMIALNKLSKTRQNQKKRFLADLSKFTELTKKGLFYEYLYKAVTDEIITDKKRTEIKKNVFGIFYSKNEHYQNKKKDFKKLFPELLNVIEILKSKKYKSLSILMQKVESYIFIDCIAKELVNNNIIPLTIHDSVIIEKKHQTKALEIMNKVFTEQIGITPTLKIENV